jgi:beta-lactamase superfamily II metal-dependent hydrolase
MLRATTRRRRTAVAKKIIGSDTAKVFETATGQTVIVTLYWGDEVDVVSTPAGGRPKIKFRKKPSGGPAVTVDAFLHKDVSFTDDKPLKVRYIDVGQGDGAIVETPSGKLLLIDGGEEGHLRNYLGTVFPTSVAIDTIVVTHGDADHFEGLTKLLTGPSPKVTVERVFHNGLAKRPSKKGNKTRPDEEMFGATAEKQGELYCTELVDDLRTVPVAELNAPFQDWQAALKSVKKANGGKTTVERLAAGSDFKHYDNEGVKVDVLGPVEETVGGKAALKMLHASATSSSFSASHTVNGHSVVLHLTFGNVRFLFAADLNEESEDLLLGTNASLQSEVLKVPHHGSADFSRPLLEAVAPIVSVVSSGDESGAKDFIHPRAILVGALGHASRSATPLILVTEMVAFFGNLSADEKKKAKDAGISQSHRLVRKQEFGIVHVRTDGKRLLVVTRGAKTDGIEAYAYKVDAAHNVKPTEVIKA